MARGEPLTRRHARRLAEGPLQLNAVLDRSGGSEGVIRPTGVIGLFILLPLSCGPVDVSLPPVRPVAIFQPPSACFLPPQPPPVLLVAPVDPAECVPLAARRIPLELTVTAGRVVAFRLYEQCTGQLVELTPGAEKCLRTRLATWRYLVWDSCPGVDDTAETRVSLVEQPRPPKSAALETMGLCSAS